MIAAYRAMHRDLPRSAEKHERGKRFPCNEPHLDVAERISVQKNLEDDFADFMTTIWTRIIKEAQFSLRSPTSVVPAISAVLEGDERGLARLGSLLLAARHATNWRLPEDIAEEIQRTVKVTAGEV